MKEKLEDLAQFGISQHMLYGVCKEDPEPHLRTLREALQFVTSPRFLSGCVEHMDVCVPVDEPYRSKAIDLLNEYRKKKGMEFIYNAHLLPFKDFYPGYPDGSNGIGMDEMIALSIKEIDAARAIGATKIVIAPGRYSQNEDAAMEGLETYMTAICRYIQETWGNMTLLLEPFDREFKDFLIGPSERTAKFIAGLGGRGLPVGVSLDMAHVALLREDFEYSIRTYNDFGLIEHVHIGNCVIENQDSPDYGDTHPAIGIEGGEIGVPELERILKALLEIRYLSKERRGTLTIESRRFPGMNEEETVRHNFGLLFKAWENLEPQ